MGAFIIIFNILRAPTYLYYLHYASVGNEYKMRKILKLCYLEPTDVYEENKIGKLIIKYKILII